MTYPVHPITATFPEMDAGRFAELKDDIAQNGVYLPVVLWRGQVVDGRHRARACDELAIECPTQERECDEAELPALVWSLNGQRRDLTASQRAIISARMAGLMSGSNQYKKSGRVLSTSPRNPVPLSTIKKAAGLAGVSTAYVDRALRVIRTNDKDMIQNVEQGNMTIDAAFKVLKAKPAPPDDEDVLPERHPMPGAGPRGERAIRLPAHERFARAVEMMETAAAVALEHVTASNTDMRRNEMLESVKSVRATLTRIIKKMEVAA